MSVKWSAFTAGSAISGSDIPVGLQSGGNVQWTWTQVRTFLLGTSTSTLSIAAGKTLTSSVTMTLQGGDASILSITAAKTLTATNTLTLSGTDSTTMTFPSTSATIARTDAGQTFTDASTITSWVANTVDARGTWTAGATWTLPAITLGGTVSGGGQQLNNIIIGTTTPLAGTFTTIVGTSGSVTGALTARSATATPAAASAVAALSMGTTPINIYFGSGSPNTALTAPKGSLYLRSDGTGVADRAYINTDSSTAWVAIATSG